MFAEILKEIVDGTAGGVGVVLMGYDGIAIEQQFKPCDGVDLQVLAIEYANILKEIRDTVALLNTGDMEEVSIKTGRFYVVIRILTDEYFVALMLQRDGNFGKGRYLLQRDAPKLVEALR